MNFSSADGPELDRILGVLPTGSSQQTQPHPNQLVMPETLRPDLAMQPAGPFDQGALSEAELEAALSAYVIPLDSLMKRLQLNMSTIFVAAFACRGDLEDTEALLTGQYQKLKRPPIPRHHLKQAFLNGFWP